ncbi:MAG: FtsX-like permease family protein [Firmicutes bacterium]|nr:FtsX-like permease family protein [Bacillota bacterium]
MNVLTKKLWRTIQRTKGQFLALVTVVMVGVIVNISMSTSYNNLKLSQDLFYQENNFADYYFHVVKAPQEVIKQIESVPGVIRATGRIQKDVPILKENKQRATARLTSYPLPLDTAVNRLHLLTGRLFEKYPAGGGIEILLDPQYAAANSLAINDQVTIVAEGKRVPLTVVGTATSPEFIYPMKDAASLMPEPKTFGIIMLPHHQAQQILNLTGQINQVVVQLAPGVDEEKVAEQIKLILEPYGNLASYPRKQQLSHAVLQGELDGLKTQSYFLPIIFLVIAAAIQFVMLSRLVKTQRLPIGVMKALGYSNWQIMLHYTGYALSVAVLAAVLGTLLGVWLAAIFSATYAQYFNLPQAIGALNIKSILSAFGLSLSVGVLAGLTATRQVVTINPAESMRPEPPRSPRKMLLERWTWLWRNLEASWKMGLRSIGRNRLRFSITVLGIIFAVGMLVVALFTRDSIDYLLKTHFEQEQHYDYFLRFTAPVKEYELLNISRIDGVIITEPIFELPVKMHFAGRSAEDVLLGLPLEVKLKELVSESGQPLRLPAEGLLINERTARKLGVKVGDEIVIETLLGLGPAHSATAKIVGINRQLVGGSSYISLDQANRVLQEKQLISGAMLKVDPGKTSLVEEKLNELTGVSSILSREKELDNFNQNLDSLVYAISIMITFAAILGFAIVYNASVINFAERKRELASLRVIGFSSQEVSELLMKETFLQSLLGVTLGLPFGNLMARAYVQAASTELFTMPAVVYPLTYVLSALLGIGFIVVAHLFAVKGVKQLDLVAVLKNND